MTQIVSADAKIWMALETHAKTFTGCTLMLPMDNYAPTAKDTFAIIQHVSLEYGGALPINPDCGVPFDGFLSIGVCTPTDWKYSALIGLASRVADHFKDGASVSYSDITVKFNGRSKVDGNVILQAPWNRIEVRVPWRAWG